MEKEAQEVQRKLLSKGFGLEKRTENEEFLRDILHWVRWRFFSSAELKLIRSWVNAELKRMKQRKEGPFIHMR